jgi:ribose transport system ATP-binding protein
MASVGLGDSVAASVPALAVRGVSKAYGSTQALHDVSLTVEPGTIHALLGGNGSGKSTLIKILAGVVNADAGELIVKGDATDARSQTPAAARAMQLHFVHQQSSTFDDLSVAENLAIGRGFSTGVAGRIRWREQRKRSSEVLARFGIAAEPAARVGELGSATQMMVAIARALQDQDHAHDGVLLLDEPTASLPPHEVDILLSALRRYADSGQSIVYVTHRLDEVMRVADAATVLRDGRKTAELRSGEFDHDELVDAIMGRALVQVTRPEMSSRPHAGGDPVLELRGGDDDALLSLHAGECVAVAGLLGSGRSALLRRIFGVLPRPDEELVVDGQTVPAGAPWRAMRAGIAYVPEDRPRDAIFADQSITENLSVVTLDTFRRVRWVDRRAERARARQLIDDYHVRASSEAAPLGSLSGGNQQKVVVARWMQREPRVLLLDEPTQGVDVGARAEIHAIIRRAVEAGAAALVVSSEFDELVALGDRAIVMRGGRIAGEAAGSDMAEGILNTLVYAQEAVA